MIVARLATALFLALILAGCGSASRSGEPASTSPSSPPSMATTSRCEPLPDGALTPRASPAIENRPTMYLTGVSEDTESNGCSAIVIFEFEKQAPGPGFEVSYQPASTAKIEDGSGNPVDIAGTAFLVVKLTPAMTAKINGDQVTKTYTGPRRVQSDDPSLVEEIVKTGDFENTVTWVIGLDEKRPFKTNASSSQLEVDIG